MPTPDAVKEKYDNIYRGTAALLRQVIEVDTVSPEERYAYLQRAVPAVWHDIAQTKNPLKSNDALAKCIEDYENTSARFMTPDGESESLLGQIEQWKRRFISDTLRQIEFDTVVELGSGWGHRLVDLWLSCRSTERAQARYVACELSQKGVACAELLGTLFEDLNMTALPFNMLTPDFSALAVQPTQPLVYSVHAIEQLPEVSPHLFDTVLDAFPNVRGVHFEPITFQLPDQAVIDEERYRRDLHKAEGSDQNRNLFEVLSNHPKIEVTDIQPAVWQIADGHSVSVVMWKAKPA